MQCTRGTLFIRLVACKYASAKLRNPPLLAPANHIYHLAILSRFNQARHFPGVVRAKYRKFFTNVLAPVGNFTSEKPKIKQHNEKVK